MADRVLFNTRREANITRYQLLVAGLLAAGAIFLLLQSGLSLRWNLAHDAAVLHYGAFLIDHYDFVPYRDLYDTSLPLTYLFHLAIGTTLGYGNMAFRIVDVAYLAALLFVTFRIMRPFGSLVAWAAVVAFGILYQSFGHFFSLQRDYLAILPAAVAIWVAGSGALAGRRWRYLVVGAMFGLGASIKPHFVIGLPAVLLYALATDGQAIIPWKKAFDWRGFAGAVALAGVGLALAIAMPVAWVWYRGGLPALGSMVSEYLPLYSTLNGKFLMMGPREKWLYVFYETQVMGGKAGLLMTTVLGLYFGLIDSTLPAAQRRLVVLLAVLTPVYLLYTLIAAKFWAHHWMPFYYFAVCSSALALLPVEARGSATARRIFVLVAFAVGLGMILRPAPEFIDQVFNKTVEPGAHGRADIMTEFLARELEPGDTVQTLECVSGGSTTAFRRVGARLATPYICSTRFYHHLSTPTTQAFRRDFIARLEAAPPRFITSVPGMQQPRGPDTTTEFAELARFLAERYTVVLSGDSADGASYYVYERRDEP